MQRQICCRVVVATLLVLILEGSFTRPSSAYRARPILSENVFEILFSDHLAGSRMLHGDPGLLYPVRMSNGSRYVCSLPDVESMTYSEDHLQEQVDPHMSSFSTLPLDGDSVPMEISKLLDEAIARKSCLISIRHWWSYELCWGQFVRQFHTTYPKVGLQKGKKSSEVVVTLSTSPPAQDDNYYLGFSNSHLKRLQQNNTVPSAMPVEEVRVSGEFSAVPQQYMFRHDSTGKYLETTYTNGTPCDLTGVQRAISLRLYCAEGNEPRSMFSVEEVGTCKYTATVALPEACIPELRTEYTVHPIRCFHL